MHSSNDSNRRRRLAAISAIAFGIMFFTNPLTHLISRGAADTPFAIATRGFAVPLHMAMLVGAVFGITQLLRSKADRLGLLGGAITIMGWAVGVRILALGQLESLLASGVTGLPQDTLTKMFAAAPIVWTSIVPIGLLFPIGLITLGATLVAVHPIPRPIGALLVLGGILFPLGRIGQFPWALVSCDLVLGAAFIGIGWQIASQREGTVVDPDKLADVADAFA
jgi:hypothetical protein